VAAGGLALGAGRLRKAGAAGAIAALLIAPAAWSAETPGHVTSGTFPAGGPANAGGGFGGPGGGFRGNGGPPNFGGQGGTGTAPGGGTGTVPGTGGSAGTTPGGSSGGPGGGGAGGFGQDSSSLTSVLSYISSHGGGNLAVSSQSTAASAIVAGHTNVVGLGGFSGRESEVTTAWLAQQVRDGHIRWVLADSGGFGMGNDGRVGASAVMAAVQQVGKAVTVNGTTVYDLSGQAGALAAA
jgi:hypothetical protein